MYIMPRKKQLEINVCPLLEKQKKKKRKRKDKINTNEIFIKHNVVLCFV